MPEDMLTWSEWRLEHEAPAAVVIAAATLGNGNIKEGLRKIARDTSKWPGRVAAWLLEEPHEIERIRREIAAGLWPREQLIREAEECGRA